MLAFELKVNLSQLAKLAKKIDGTSARVFGRLRDVVEVDLNLARADMISTYLSNANTTPTGLARRSGNLIRSWRVTMEDKSPGTFEGRMAQDQRFASAVYGPVQEFGATIRAKRAKNLAIPLTDEARQAGSPRKFNDLFPIRSKKGNLLLVRRSGQQIEPLYKLQPSVTIPPRPHARPTSEKWFPIILRSIGTEMAAIEQDWGSE